MDVLRFAGRVVIVVIALMVIFSCGLVALLGYQLLSPQVVVEAPVEVERVVEVPIEVERIVEVPVEVERVVEVPAEGIEKICRFAEDFNAEGKVVPAGTLISGPSFVKPDRNLDWGRPVYVGEEYTTRASDEVVWLLAGDNACVDAQAEFFSHWGKNPK